jgi:hypothetical protein
MEDRIRGRIQGGDFENIIPGVSLSSHWLENGL